jgi:hypothetical protein
VPQCVARHKVTREKRVWRDRDDCQRWFKYKAGPEFDINEWDLADEEVPFWGSGMPHPREDGTDGYPVPIYDTPDGKPAG